MEWNTKFKSEYKWTSDREDSYIKEAEESTEIQNPNSSFARYQN